MNYNIVSYEIMRHAEKKRDREKQAYRTLFSLTLYLKE